MKSDRWTSKPQFLNRNLDERIYMQYMKDSFKINKKEILANCKSPFMDISKHLEVGILVSMM